jgi:hypothetical protein
LPGYARIGRVVLFSDWVEKLRDLEGIAAPAAPETGHPDNIVLRTVAHAKVPVEKR